MSKATAKVREEARELFLTGQMTTNSEIAARLRVKPHTVGIWRKQEDWDGLRLKVSKQEAERMVRKIATDRVTLNVRHYRYWDLLMSNLAEMLKSNKDLAIKELDCVAGILDRAQKGQRLAKGMGLGGETEEAIRAETQAELRKAINLVREAIKENVTDEETRDRIGRAILPRFLRSLALELTSRKTRSTTEPLAQWAARRIILEGRRFSFEGHEYLKGLYDETAQHVVLMKAAQVGGTVWGILRSIHACLNGLNVVYYFPTKNDVMDFSKSRVSPLLDDNPFLSQLMNDTDAVGLKRIGDAFLYLRGMKSSVGLKSVPADMVVFDELDEVTPQAKTMAKERLAHSPYKRIIELSNPSLPDFGIDEVFQKSDQRHWNIKCSRCNHWTALDKEFPTKLNEQVRIILPSGDGTYFRACVNCSAPLDLAAGEWVADFPGRPIHGYRISQLISSRVDAAEILNDYQITRFPDQFYRLKIGIPWVDLERRLDLSSVVSLCTDLPMLDKSDESCVMGVDTGKALHVVILRQDDTDDDYERYRLVHLGVYREFEQLSDLMQRFNVERCVIDALPETHATREFAKRHGGSVFMSYFPESQHGAAKWDLREHEVRVNRTDALDASRAAVRNKKLILPRRDPKIEQFARHMIADAKKLEEDKETGAQKYRYIKTGTNHFSFAFTYAWMAASDNTGFRAWMEFFRHQRNLRGLR